MNSSTTITTTGNIKTAYGESLISGAIDCDGGDPWIMRHGDFYYYSKSNKDKSCCAVRAILPISRQGAHPSSSTINSRSACSGHRKYIIWMARGTCTSQRNRRAAIFIICMCYLPNPRIRSMVRGGSRRWTAWTTNSRLTAPLLMYLAKILHMVRMGGIYQRSAESVHRQNGVPYMHRR